VQSPDNSAVTIAVVGVLATCVGGLLWVIKFMFTKLLPIIEKGAKSTETLIEATNRNTKEVKNNAAAHKQLVKAIDKIPEHIAVANEKRQAK
jgi:hypothetical protein